MAGRDQEKINLTWEMAAWLDVLREPSQEVQTWAELGWAECFASFSCLGLGDRDFARLWLLVFPSLSSFPPFPLSALHGLDSGK